MNQHMIWCLFQTALTLLCLAAAFAQLALYLQS